MGSRRLSLLNLLGFPIMSDPEKRAIEEESSLEESVKLDRHGLPLIPQPSDDPNDPLNWPYRKKIMILVIMSTLAFFGSFSLAVMNPACLSDHLPFQRSSHASSRCTGRHRTRQNCCASLFYRHLFYCRCWRRILSLVPTRRCLWQTPCSSICPKFSSRCWLR